MNQQIESLGPPVSHLALTEGVSVFDRDGRRIGVVDEVVTDGPTGIFEGLLVHPSPLPSRHLYARPDQVAELRRRGVILSVDRDALEDVRMKSASKRPVDGPVEHPLHAFLRRVWDKLTGLR